LFLAGQLELVTKRRPKRRVKATNEALLARSELAHFSLAIVPDNAHTLHMHFAAEYREFAHEAMKWAKTAQSENERAIFLEMVRTWTEAAVALERKLEKIH